MSGKLFGKVALVTGAGRGIGRGIALRLARDGADIGLTDIKSEGISTVAQEIRDLGQRASTFTADTSNRSEVSDAINHAERELGKFDIMVNNAGIAQVKPIAEIREDEFKRILNVNVAGTLWWTQLAAARFIERQQRGKIINACSIAGHESYAMLGAYCASKYAVRALTQTAAKEYAGKGITVNAYCPGIIGTDMWVDIDKKFAEFTGAEIGATYKQFVNGIALGRPGTPEDIAKLVSFLAGPESDYITGQAILADGGLVFR